MSKHTRRNVVLLAVCGAAVLGAALLVVQRLGLGGVVRERYTLGPIPKATYIGSEACGRCHEDAYADWQRSGHSRVIINAREHPGAIIGDFTQLDEFGRTHSLPRFGPDDVRLVHGSLWKQAYVNEDWRVWPAQWNIPLEQWQELRPQDWQKRDWRRRCASCHVTGFDPATLRWKELGVGCESCHGPGSVHADAPPGKRKSTIVNPRLLTPDMAADICGQCHTRGKTPDGKFDFPVGFLPGGKLLPSHFVPVSREDRKAWWPDGSPKKHRLMFPGWKRSAHRDAGVTCITCHVPHGGDLKHGTRKVPNQLCRDCHADISTDPLTGHAPIEGAPQHSNCIACHMAPTGKIAQQGDERVHTFRVVRPEVTVKLGRGDVRKQPNSCNHCHAHEEDAPARLQLALENGLAMKHLRAGRPAEGSGD